MFLYTSFYLLRYNLCDLCDLYDLYDLLLMDLCNRPTLSSTKSSTVISTSSTSSIKPLSTGPGGVTIECPGTDNTNYTVPGTNQVFLRECNTNRIGSDIAFVEQNTMTDCLSYCATWNVNSGGSTRCLSVTWAYQAPQGTGDNYCWIKSSVPGVSTYANMESAILII
jgi:hypothetical protein